MKLVTLFFGALIALGGGIGIAVLTYSIGLHDQWQLLIVGAWAWLMGVAWTWIAGL